MKPTLFMVNNPYLRTYREESVQLRISLLKCFFGLEPKIHEQNHLKTTFSLVKSHLNSLVMLVPLFLMAPVMAAMPIQKYSIAWQPKSQVVSE